MADEPAPQPPAPEAPSGDSLDEGPGVQGDTKVQELEERLSALTERLEGMDKEKAEGVGDKFSGMEERMKSLLQLSEILSVRYNPFLDSEEKDLFEHADPNKFLPKHAQPAKEAKPDVVPVEPDEPTPEAPPAPRPSAPAPQAPPAATDAPPQAPSDEERFHGEVVPIEPDDVIESEAPAGSTHAAPKGEVGPEAEAPDIAAPTQGPPHERNPYMVPGTGDGESSQDALDAILEEAHAYLPDEPAQDVPDFEPEPLPEALIQAAKEPAPGPAPGAGPAAGSARSEASSSAPEPATREWEPAIEPAASPAPMPAAVPGSLWAPSHTGGRSKQTYWALCWYERLAEQGDPAEIHLFLDHYTRLGWVPRDAYGWMRSLADSIAPRRDDLAWEDLQLHGVDLARLHKDNLRFLQRLFQAGFDDPDPDAWRRQADDWLGGI